jgi:DNA-binding protein YbaB
MSTPLHQQLESALANMRVQQARIKAASEQLAKATATAASKDRAIEATVDSQGKLTALNLKGTGYRKLAPAELAARIVDTVRSAQDAVGRQAAEALTGLMPTGLGLGMAPTVSSDGGWDIDAMFEAAARAAQEPLVGGDAAARRKAADRG